MREAKTHQMGVMVGRRWVSSSRVCDAGAQAGELVVVLWPMSYMFQALADAPTPVASAEIVEIWAIGIASNVILYALIGAVTTPIVYFVTHRRKAA